MYQKFGKRLLDILLSACGIVVLSPVFLLVALASSWTTRGRCFSGRSGWASTRPISRF